MLKQPTNHKKTARRSPRHSHTRHLRSSAPTFSPRPSPRPRCLHDHTRRTLHNVPHDITLSDIQRALSPPPTAFTVTPTLPLLSRILPQSMQQDATHISSLLSTLPITPTRAGRLTLASDHNTTIYPPLTPYERTLLLPRLQASLPPEQYDSLVVTPKSSTATSFLHLRRLQFNAIFALGKPFLPDNFLTTLTHPGPYWHYARHQFLANVFGSASSVVSMQALLLSVGLSAVEATPAAAALTWILKDLFGSIGGSLFASQISQRYELQPRLARMHATILYTFASFIEILSPLCHDKLLLLATCTTLMKNVSWIVTASSKATTHLTFTPINHIGEVTAKSGAQSTAAGVIGTSLGASLSYYISQFPDSMATNSATKATKAEGLSPSQIDTPSVHETVANSASLTTDTLTNFSQSITETADSSPPILLALQCSLFIALSLLSIHHTDKSLQQAYFKRFDLQRFTLFFNTVAKGILKKAKAAHPESMDEKLDKDVKEDILTFIHGNIDNITTQESLYHTYNPPNNDKVSIIIGNRVENNTTPTRNNTINKIKSLFNLNSKNQKYDHGNKLYRLGDSPTEIYNTIRACQYLPYFLAIHDIRKPPDDTKSLNFSSSHISLQWKPETLVPPIGAIYSPLSSADALQYHKRVDSNYLSPQSPILLHPANPRTKKAIIQAGPESSWSRNSQKNSLTPTQHQLLGVSHALLLKQLLLQYKYTSQYPTPADLSASNHDLWAQVTGKNMLHAEKHIHRLAYHYTTQNQTELLNDIIYGDSTLDQETVNYNLNRKLTYISSNILYNTTFPHVFNNKTMAEVLLESVKQFEYDIEDLIDDFMLQDKQYDRDGEAKRGIDGENLINVELLCGFDDLNQKRPRDYYRGTPLEYPTMPINVEANEIKFAHHEPLSLAISAEEVIQAQSQTNSSSSRHKESKNHKKTGRL